VTLRNDTREGAIVLMDLGEAERLQLRRPQPSGWL
jgi:hypothetical protein